MLFRTVLVAFLSAAAAANIVPSADIPATSSLGQRLLSSATVVEHARHLDQERDVTFVAKYSLRYLGCSSLIQVNPEGAGGDEGMLYTQNLVRFALCPSDSCSSCTGGGEYVMNMMEFVDAYTEAKLNEKEYQCEMIRENCDCENANDDEACENQCYTNAGMADCIEYEGEEEFEIQRYLECEEIEGNNNNNNNNNGNWQDGYYGQIFVGPYCSPKDGKSIFLGVFKDEQCTAKGDDSLYAARNYGATLPFSQEPIVTSECISCEEVDRDNNNNNNNQNNGNNNYYQQQELEVSELCEQSYEMAARCEEKMDIQYKDTSGCEYINDILPRLESASRSLNVGSGGGSGGTASKVFVGIFAFTTVLFAAYSYFLYRKIKRGSVNLSSQE